MKEIDWVSVCVIITSIGWILTAIKFYQQLSALYAKISAMDRRLMKIIKDEIVSDETVSDGN